MVLQAGHHEPSVRHALAAIGSLHEKLLSGTIDPIQPQDSRTRFALEQCNKSIKYLVKPENAESTKPNLRLMLTTCVLFTCFEALQGHCEQAILHATQGYSLLQQYAADPESRRWDLGAFAVELDQLCLLMRRLQTQSKGLMVSIERVDLLYPATTDDGVSLTVDRARNSTSFRTPTISTMHRCQLHSTTSEKLDHRWRWF